MMRRPNNRRARSMLLPALVAAMFFIPGIAYSQTASAGSSDAALARLTAARAAHPDDPDLAWALTRELAEAGQAELALRGMQDFIARWPSRRPEARMEIALTLLDAGQALAAIELLDQEITDRPLSALARFYRGIAHRSLGKNLKAESDFRIAGELEPALRTETLLARALGLFDRGREQDAIELLQEILTSDPTSEAALRARLMLREREVLAVDSPWRADAYVGFEWDDNVTLAGSENEAPASESEDFRGIWGGGFSWRAYQNDTAAVTVGYRLDQTVHDELGEFDILNNAAFATANWRPMPKLALRFDGLVFNTLQDLDNELTGGTIRPSLLYVISPDWGALRLFGQLDIFEYADAPFLEVFERDAMVFSVGLEHILPLRAENARIVTSIAWSRNLTQAGTSGGADGFDGDFDYDGIRLRGQARYTLPWQLVARVRAAYTHDRYHNDNLANALSSLQIKKRRDDILSGRIALSRAIVPHVEVEVYWTGTRRISNVDLYDYDKQQAGVLFRFTTD